MNPESTIGNLTRETVQRLLDRAFHRIDDLYADTPDLLDALQFQVREALMSSLSDPSRDPTQILYQQMRMETRVLNAYNKHRLGQAMNQDTVEYNEADNIPPILEWFPLHSEISKCGIKVTVPEIYQVVGAVEHMKGFAAKSAARTISIDKLPPNNDPSPISPVLLPKMRTGRAAANYDKLADAPLAQLPFPNGNMTMVEVLAFFPQSLRSWDIIDRFLYNGAFSVTLAIIINHFRIMPNGPIGNNSIYAMMKASMMKRAQDDATYENWSVSQQVPRPVGFDEASVSVAGFRAGVYGSKRIAAAIAAGPPLTVLFRDLATGVKVFPSGDDALDLTRCVQYCLDHPRDDWYYPQQYEELVIRLGSAPIQSAHQDAEVVNRYTTAQKLQGAKVITNRKRDSHGRLLKVEKNGNHNEEAGINFQDSEHNQANLEHPEDEDGLSSSSGSFKRRKAAYGRHGPTRLRNESKASDIVSDSDSDAYQGPKKTKKTPVNQRVSGRTKRVVGKYDVDAALNVSGDEEEE